MQVEVKEKKWADEIQIQMVKIEADKQLTHKEMELQVQTQVNTGATDPSPPNTDKFLKLRAFVDEKDELGTYLLRFEHHAENAKLEKVTWALK